MAVASVARVTTLQEPGSAVTHPASIGRKLPQWSVSAGAPSPRLRRWAPAVVAKLAISMTTRTTCDAEASP